MPATHRLLLTSLFCFLLVSCGSSPERDVAQQPAWINGNSKQYSDRVYVLGVGEADTLQDAKGRARAEIAKIFQVSIHETSIDSQSFQAESNSKGTSVEQASEISRTIRATSDQVLEGVELAQSWTDPDTQRVYALAVLPRAKATLLLRTQIAELDRELNAKLVSAQSANSLITKIKAASSAVEIQRQRAVVNKQLMIVSNSAQGVDSKVSLAKLEADRQALLARVTIQTSAVGVSRREIRETLANTLSNAGFTVVNEGEYRITTTLNSRPLPAQGGWYSHRSVLSVAVMDRQGQRLGGYDWSYKPSATQRQLADARVTGMARSHIETELVPRLLELLSER